MAREQRKAKDGRRESGRIELAGLKGEEEAPRLEVHTIDRSGKVIASSAIEDDGRFSLSRKDLDAADRVVIAAANRDPEEPDPAETLAYRVRDFRSMLGEETAIVIGRPDWTRFLFTWQCVDGSVSRCFPYPWLIREWMLDASRVRVAQLEETGSALERRGLAQLEDALIASPGVSLPSFPLGCETVCDGLVEVYKRTCCCRPWFIKDPVLMVIHKLKEIVVKPVFPPPPGPGPDPAPDIGLFKEGTLDEAALRAEADIAQIQALSGPDQVAYIEARPYLHPFWCSCGEAKKVGQGWIRPDGTFGVCWLEGLHSSQPECHDEYAFVVRQFLGGETTVIYNGLAANRWFSHTTGISLVSHSARARGCGGGNPPGSGAFALLQDIGDAHSHQLKTPDADGWDSVAPPSYNDGLLNPAANPTEAKGQYKDQNLGGTLKLRYHFSDEMEGTGAAYYRISIAEADAGGNPTGTRKALDSALSWLYYEDSSGEILIGSEGLGPVTRNGEANLYRIPYPKANREWLNGQYHGYLPTTEFANGRHLVMLEVFDEEGQRLRPAGSSGPGVDASFEFRRWYQPTGLMANVPFAALTHMLWWDNRSAVAHIEDLRMDGVASGAECQFLSGTDSSKFSSGYRAYHPNPMFILNHVMWWRRGLGGPSGSLLNSDENAGQPPASVAVTDPAAGEPPATFANMLGLQMKCSFALNLHVNVKTTDGEGILTYLNADDQAAFALERS
jgi:hypothetical protein